MQYSAPPAGPTPPAMPPAVLARPTLPPATPGAKTGRVSGIQVCHNNDDSINASNAPQGLGAVRGKEAELTELLCQKLLRIAPGDAGPQTPEEALAFIYNETGAHIVGCMKLDKRENLFSRNKA